MNSYLRFMTSATGRALRFLIGAALLAWGYAEFTYPDNAVLMTVGGVIALLAALDISAFGLAVCDSVLGSDVRYWLKETGMPANAPRMSLRRALHEHVIGRLSYNAAHPLGWSVFRNEYRLSH